MINIVETDGAVQNRECQLGKGVAHATGNCRGHVEKEKNSDPKIAPKTHCVMVRFDDAEWNRYLFMYDK